MIRRYLNGETHLRRPQVSIRQSITYGREPGELKHLSRRRRRKKHRFPERRAKGKSPNQSACTLGLRTAYVSRFVNGMVLERPAGERVKAPYMKTIGSSRIQSTARQKPCGKSGTTPNILVTDSASSEG